MKSKVLRIIDANINRSVEGLRVMEEVARFVLEQKQLTEQIKKMRNQLRMLAVKLSAIGSREALADVGNKLYTKSEAKRESVKDVFTANAKRVQEALRVLEEFSKLTEPGVGKELKAIRFKVYALEKKITIQLNQ